MVVIQDVLRAYNNNAPAQEGVMTAGYRAVFDAITSVVPINESQGQFLLVPETGVPENVWTWIGSAEGVNQAEGGFSGFIRSYTFYKRYLRNGEELTAAEIQRASNDVAANFLSDLLQNLEKTAPENWILPTIVEIGGADAGAAVPGVFDGDYAPWAGTLLFRSLKRTLSLRAY